MSQFDSINISFFSGNKDSKPSFINGIKYFGDFHHLPGKPISPIFPLSPGGPVSPGFPGRPGLPLGPRKVELVKLRQVSNIEVAWFLAIGHN